MKNLLCCCVLGVVALAACSDDLDNASATTSASAATSSPTDPTEVTLVETSAPADPTTTVATPPTLESTTTVAVPPTTLGSATTTADAAASPVVTGVFGSADGTTAVWNASAGTTTCQDRETWSFSGPTEYPARDSGWGYHCWPTHSTTPLELPAGTWTATLTIYLNGKTASASATIVVPG